MSPFFFTYRRPPTESGRARISQYGTHTCIILFGCASLAEAETRFVVGGINLNIYLLEYLGWVVLFLVGCFFF